LGARARASWAFQSHASPAPALHNVVPQLALCGRQVSVGQRQQGAAAQLNCGSVELWVKLVLHQARKAHQRARGQGAAAQRGGSEHGHAAQARVVLPAQQVPEGRGHALLPVGAVAASAGAPARKHLAHDVQRLHLRRLRRWTVLIKKNKAVFSSPPQTLAARLLWTRC
jgi:hypothetical protein